MNAPQPPSRFTRGKVRVARHLRWVRRGGIARLVEEDQLDPFERRRMAAARKRWVAEHPGIAPNAGPVFLVGVQRSGTNMLVRGFERSGAFDVCNENDARVFTRFRLRPLDEVRNVVTGSGHAWVLLKPLAESHRTPELLDRLGTPTSPKAIWAFRGVDGRVRSAVAKFGPNNLLALRAIVGGECPRMSVDAPSEEMVELIREGLSDDSLTWLRSLDLDDLDPAAGAAAFWYVRNRLYFELGLDRRDDVMPSSYDRMIEDPPSAMRPLCGFLGVDYTDDLVAHVDRRSASPSPVALPPEIRERCADLQQQLDRALEERLGT